ncbi:hypothetical protein GCM10010497_23890 [Streptomyces cinereoruber]|uniref:Uncharacterized protein n=1 Tax=Streptomyces cinereoruber TaxID=67260 RepID=A0AAV4KH53_9ACTN|nr:hypothetical protein GCM10010497_23890 [Streptomyces cinereoruber]
MNGAIQDGSDAVITPGTVHGTITAMSGQVLVSLISLGGVVLTTELSQLPGGRALYDPRPGEPPEPDPGIACRFHCTGHTSCPARSCGPDGLSVDSGAGWCGTARMGKTLKDSHRGKGADGGLLREGGPVLACGPP